MSTKHLLSVDNDASISSHQPEDCGHVRVTEALSQCCQAQVLTQLLAQDLDEDSAAGGRLILCQATARHSKEDQKRAEDAT